MRLFFTTIFALGFCFISNAQSYSDSLKSYRADYKKEFLKSERSPIKDEADLSYIHFYGADENYRVSARFKRTKNAKVFEMPTSSGKTKTYIEYGRLSFHLNGAGHVLRIYQNVSLIANPEFKDHLFLPFTDSTNGDETYINGRYLDFETGDIVNNRLVIDFNKAYNPYCAYSSGFSCPRPPEENRLRTAIRAGEKNYLKHGD